MMPNIIVELQKALGGVQGQTQQPSAQQPQQAPASPTATGDPAITAVLQQVLKQYPGLAKNFNAQNTLAVMASGDRAQRGLKERGGLEFWPPSEAGSADFPSPAPGKNVLEVYDPKMAANPAGLRQAVYGDLMHGMTADPNWANLRGQFMQNFTPEEIARQQQHKTWWEDVNGSKGPAGNPTYDAYIRGWIADEGGGKQGQQESKGTMYSPQQVQELQQMQDYLNTGKAQQPVASKGAQ
jgi:hypothetical protein